MVSETLRLGDTDIEPGSILEMALPVPALSAHLPATLPVRIYRSAKPGPRLFITSVIHGDEVIGLDIIARLCASGILEHLTRGDVILVPIANLFGFIQQSRYLPDRRDLNRSFPGSRHGSLAGRLAHFLFKEIISQSTHGIDLHSGAADHFNLPQIRVCRKDEKAMELARAFAPPVILEATNREGSLRESAASRRIPVLLFEGAEAGRFDKEATRTGFEGICRVLAALGMTDTMTAAPGQPSFIASESRWQRAPESGIFRTEIQPGDKVRRGEIIGSVSDFFGKELASVTAERDGMVIGQTYFPAVNEGDALFHIARANIEET